MVQDAPQLLSDSIDSDYVRGLQFGVAFLRFSLDAVRGVFTEPLVTPRNALFPRILESRSRGVVLFAFPVLPVSSCPGGFPKAASPHGCNMLFAGWINPLQIIFGIQRSWRYAGFLGSVLPKGG